MTSAIGTFIWYELATSDTAAAEAFYRRVVGWNARDAGMEGQAYTLLSAGTDMVAGLFSMAGEGCDGPPKPCWMGYIGVEDVDVLAAQVRESGGTVLRPPEDIPGVGRFAVAADPYGAVFMLFKGTSDQGPAPVPAGGSPGRIGWHELHAGNGEGSFAFYAKLFGWTKAEALDMGPLGVYQLFATGGVPVGGMMTKTPDTPAPFWLYYINVEALDAALAEVEAGGGRLLMGPHEVPGGSWIAQCLDPQGALFALVAPSRG